MHIKYQMSRQGQKCQSTLWLASYNIHVIRNNKNKGGDVQGNLSLVLRCMIGYKISLTSSSCPTSSLFSTSSVWSSRTSRLEGCLWWWWWWRWWWSRSRRAARCAWQPLSSDERVKGHSALPWDFPNLFGSSCLHRRKSGSVLYQTIGGPTLAPVNLFNKQMPYLQVPDLLGQRFNKMGWPDIVWNLTVRLSQLVRTKT